VAARAVGERRKSNKRERGERGGSSDDFGGDVVALGRQGEQAADGATSTQRGVDDNGKQCEWTSDYGAVQF
jgi:hypothetical protein